VDRDALATVPEAAPQGNTPAVGVRRGSFRALRNKPFRLFFGGQVVSASGSFVQQTAIAWLVLSETNSAITLGLVLAVGGIPSLVLGPWGGVVADRVDLRKLLILTQSVFAVLAGTLWALAAAGHAGIPVVVTINILGGFVQIVDSPARQAFVSQLVPASDLTSAVSLNGVVMNSARVVGPALAGVLIVAVGTTPCFAVNAVSYVPLVAALLVLRPLAGRRAVREKVAEVAEACGKACVTPVVESNSGFHW
jgi:MFS family permease